MSTYWIISGTPWQREGWILLGRSRRPGYQKRQGDQDPGVKKNEWMLGWSSKDEVKGEEEETENSAIRKHLSQQTKNVTFSGIPVMKAR